MKKILITGANSYIGTSFENYLKQFEDEYFIDTVDLIDECWKDKSFSGYDVVFHVAGIAHIKETKDNAYKYYDVNRDLVKDIAEKAKTDNVKQFVFLSSMSVYGLTKGRITRSTVPNPTTNYGKSKLEAEHIIASLNDETFKVVVLRPPMVYGKGCKGNYQVLRKFSMKLKFFPYVKNERSMLYIENLCEFVRLMIDNEENGLFFPQNSEYTDTSEMVRAIATEHGRKVYLVKGCYWALRFLGLFTKLVNKAFGSLIYDKGMSGYKQNYCKCSLQDSIKESEKELE